MSVATYCLATRAEDICAFIPIALKLLEVEHSLFVLQLALRMCVVVGQWVCMYPNLAIMQPPGETLRHRNRPL